jgi:hypothetical protein
MAAPTDNKGLDTAPSAGTPTGGLKFAVQAQSSSGKIMQVILLSEFTETTEITGLDVNSTTTVVTPNAFTLTTASESRVGTNENASDAEISGQTTTHALVAEKIEQIFQSGIPAGTAISGSDFDAATEGTESALSLYKTTYGNRSTIEGTFTFVPNVSTDTIDIYINNIRQPQYANTGTGFIISAANPTELHAAAVSIESQGADTDGIGQIKITIGRGTIAWVSGASYALGLNINYLAKF